MEADVATRNLERFVALADNFIAWVLRNMGQTTEARERNQRSLEIAAPGGLGEPWCHALADLAADQLLAGDADAADVLLDEHDIRATADHSLPWRHITRARVLRGRVALLRADPDEAEAVGATVVEDARALDMARYVVLGQILVVQARLARGDAGDIDGIGRLLEQLPAQAGLEAWWLTADVARRAGVDAWWALAERQLGQLARYAGPHRSTLEATGRRLLEH
jgi:hypothetical protein